MTGEINFGNLGRKDYYEVSPVSFQWQVVYDVVCSPNGFVHPGNYWKIICY